MNKASHHACMLRDGPHACIASDRSCAVAGRDDGSHRGVIAAPALDGADTFLAAVRHLFDWRDARVRGGSHLELPPSSPALRRWREHLEAALVLHEADAGQIPDRRADTCGACNSDTEVQPC